ncbi:MAG: hypothetical protein ACYSWP_01470 [Planctomycetota bacterium]
MHSGAEIERAEKIACHLSKDPLALRYMRSCTNNAGSAEKNCGKCYKCTRTMTSLYISGSLDKTETFPHELNKEALRRPFISRNDLGYAIENLRLARKFNVDKRFMKMLAKQIEKAKAASFYEDKTFFAAQKSLLALYFIKKPRKLIRKLSTSLRQKSKLYSKFMDFIKGKSSFTPHRYWKNNG